MCLDPSAIDWSSVWRSMYLNRSRISRRSGSVWDETERARSFLQASNDNPERIERIIHEFPVHKDSRVLDIGAGPGTIAIPLSEKVEHITAIEPAEGMVTVLKERIRDEGIDNITVVQKRWEEVEIASDLQSQYDLVFASHSLGIPDIQPAISKMCAASRKWVYIFWFAGVRPWEQDLKALWPAIHDCRYRSGPKADVLFHVLYDMGIYPNMMSYTRERIKQYVSIEEAVEEYRERCDISQPEQLTILADYLPHSLEKGEEGYIRKSSYTSVKFWWDVTEK